MAYREVTMIEITEVLRQWLGGARRKQIARRLGLDPKTVRRYLRTAERTGLRPGMDATALTEERLAALLTALRATPARPYGDTWQRCVEHREFIATQLRAGVRLSKVRRLLARQGVAWRRPRSTASRQPSSAGAARRRRSRWPTGSRARSSRSTRAG